MRKTLIGLLLMMLVSSSILSVTGSVRAHPQAGGPTQFEFLYAPLVKGNGAGELVGGVVMKVAADLDSNKNIIAAEASFDLILVDDSLSVDTVNRLEVSRGSVTLVGVPIDPPGGPRGRVFRIENAKQALAMDIALGLFNNPSGLSATVFTNMGSPDGTFRGQVKPVGQNTSTEIGSDLFATNVVPPVTNAERNASGNAVVVFEACRDPSNKTTNVIAGATAFVAGLQPGGSIINAGTYKGAAGENGPIQIPIPLASPIQVSSDGSVILPLVRLDVSPADVDAIIKKPAPSYFLVGTSLNPAGAGRGQIKELGSFSAIPDSQSLKPPAAGSCMVIWTAGADENIEAQADNSISLTATVTPSDGFITADITPNILDATGGLAMLTVNTTAKTPPKTYSVAVTASQNGIPFLATGTTLVVTAGPDFSLGFDQSTVNAQAGTKARVTVNINRTGGFNGNVTVTPPDPAGGIKPKPADPITTKDASASFKLKIGGGAALGPHQLTFGAKDDSGRERTAALTLVVQ